MTLVPTGLRSHAPYTMALDEAARMMAGEMLCSEPWCPCWEPATHYRKMENGTASVRCARCLDTAAPTVAALRGTP